MTMSTSQNRPPTLPTLPHGEQIASYATYLEAQRAVDHLSDQAFPVQHVTIVGTDLRMVERVTGRLTYSRVALGGLASGAWFGLLFGLLLSMFAGAGSVSPISLGIGLGAGFGILFSLAAYQLTGRKRDFTSASQIVATSYALLCAAEVAGRARQTLQADGGPGIGRGGVPAPVAPPVAPAVPVSGAPTQASAPPASHAPGAAAGPEQPATPTQPPAGPAS